jgi:hypothetical protein
VNGEAFLSIATSIPHQVLGKHKNQIHQLEALIFGQAGLLDAAFDEDYPAMLKNEYRYLQKKYSLEPPLASLQFLRMRPLAFPTVRLAQLSMLIHQSTHLFAKCLEADSVKEIKEMFDVTANDYWHYHYRFGDTSSFNKKTTGDDMISNLIINTIIPILFRYALYKNAPSFAEKAMRWLHALPAEKNAIVKGWLSLDVTVLDAADSQSVIELKTRYCDKKRCFHCNVGKILLANPV